LLFVTGLIDFMLKGWNRGDLATCREILGAEPLLGVTGQNSDTKHL